MVVPNTVTTIEDYGVGYERVYDDNGDDRYLKIAGFTIYGYSDTSAAAKYAAKNGIKYVNLASNPVVKKNAAITAKSFIKTYGNKMCIRDSNNMYLDTSGNLTIENLKGETIHSFDNVKDFQSDYILQDNGRLTSIERYAGWDRDKNEGLETEVVAEDVNDCYVRPGLEGDYYTVNKDGIPFFYEQDYDWETDQPKRVRWQMDDVKVAAIVDNPLSDWEDGDVSYLTQNHELKTFWIEYPQDEEGEPTGEEIPRNKLLKENIISIMEYFAIGADGKTYSVADGRKLLDSKMVACKTTDRGAFAADEKGNLYLYTETWKYPELSLIHISITGLLLSGSRSVFLLFIICLIYTAITETKKRKWIAGFSVYMLTLIAVGGILLGYVQEFARFTTSFTQNSTLWGRLLYWQDALQILKDHPFGLGYKGYYFIQGTYASGNYVTMYAHNELLQILLDFGFLGGVAIAGMLFFSLYRRRLDSSLKKKLLTVCVVHSLFDFDLQFLVVVFIILLLFDFGECKCIKTSMLFQGVVAAVLLVSIYSFSFLGLEQLKKTEAALKLFRCV